MPALQQVAWHATYSNPGLLKVSMGGPEPTANLIYPDTEEAEEHVQLNELVEAKQIAVSKSSPGRVCRMRDSPASLPFTQLKNGPCMPSSRVMRFQ